ncbi:MAG TPA: uracil-DNA glycosylase family protein [Thermoanaerobaculia bacterium]|nr:uracil-DNA glycosylase family protein [Thermoanaerobaculia bacterium]
MSTTGQDPLIEITSDLVGSLRGLEFGPPVSHVYNPLVYAREPHEQYLTRFGAPPKEVLLVGMNPGPWGMSQTGVPFGEVALVRDWLRIGGRVLRPDREHPRRPVEGFACARSEVSGRRLRGWARERFGEPERFFARFFVWNYCPLVFMEESGRNRTPDRLPRHDDEPLLAACDRALERTVAHLSPRLVVGVGRFAADRARAALAGTGMEVGSILHPSPASPAANRGWAEPAERQLRELGVELPRAS